jgi:histidyl-tRNA synthetase
VARCLRANGLQTEVDVTGHGVGPGLKLATKKYIRLALIVGDDERRANSVTVRNLETGEEQTSNIEALIHSLQEKE